MNTRRRMIGGEARRKGDGRTIEARVVTYESAPDSFGSIWARGVFTDSLNARLPVLAWGHDWGEPLGRGIDWRDAADGPYVTFRISDPDAVPRARQAIAQIADGTLTDVSVGFFNARRRDPTDAELRRWPGAREVITSAELDEVSLVLRGAVAGAELVGQRSKSPGWALARAFAEGRISRDEFQRQAELERATEEALDRVAAMNLRVVASNMDRLPPADLATYARALQGFNRNRRGGR